ncbi:MAG: hypothetical protein NXI32_26370 [bacterium]|nr:hypothetical protein [bacterium]
MEAATQPILCCIGGAVAGNPTQFVMERMLDLAQLDWRVITVAVQAEELDAALAGLKAMRFSAIQILEPYAKPAAEAMFSDDPATGFISAITSVRFHDNAWEGWHSVGPAVRRLADQSHPWSQTVCVVCGDSIRSRSMVAECLLNNPARLLWIDDQPRQRIPLEDLASQNWLISLSAEQLAEETETLPMNSQAVVVIGDSDKEMHTVAQHLQDRMAVAQRALPIYAAASQQRPQRAVERWWTELFSVSDQLVSAMAYDFERWTGQPANIAHMRDAFDEYCDF